MPRFHFHLEDRPDEEGRDLASVAAAKCEAVKIAGKLICDSAAEFWDTARLLMTVTDDRGLSPFTRLRRDGVTFSANAAPLDYQLTCLLLVLRPGPGARARGDQTPYE